MTIRNVFVVLVSVLIAMGISACDGGKMQKMSNQELQTRNDECVQGNPTSPGKVTACENVRKECERRRKEGNYTC